MSDRADEGGDPACWAHLFEDEGADPTAAPSEDLDGGLAPAPDAPAPHEA